VVIAVGAVLLEVKTIRVVTPVLLGDVVAVLAHRASHRDLRSNVSGLGHGSTFFVS
jgi:acyl dehydratase